MTLNRWARAALFTGAILTAIGVLPLFIVGTLLNAAAPVLFHMLFLMVAPLGAIILAVGIVLYIVAAIRR